MKKLNKEKTKITKSTISGILFLIPAMIFIGYAIVIPAIWNFILSFQNWDGFLKREWVGFDNYIKCFTDPVFGLALKNSLIFAIFMTAFSVVIGVIMALLIFRLGRAEGA